MKRLILLDSNSLLNRAFYAIKSLSALDGRPTNAVFGYLKMLLKLIEDYKPTHIIAAFDVKAPTFRKEMYDDYKAQRKPMPEELAQQLPIMKELFGKMNIKIVEVPGFEADDVIGTLSRKCPYDTLIVTGDKDSLQLVSDSTTVILTRKGISEVVEYTPERLKEDGLTPEQVIDLKSLMGDQSDNIPGVRGIGEKTAMSLIAEYGNLDNIYENIEKISGKTKEKLIEGRESAYMSRTLAAINTEMDIEYDENSAELTMPFSAEAMDYIADLNFTTIVSRKEFECGGESVEAGKDYENIDVRTPEELEKLLESVKSAGIAAIIDESELQIAYSEDKNYCIKLRENFLEAGLDSQDIERVLGEIIRDENIGKILFNAKKLMHKFGAIERFDDLAIKAYVTDSTGSYDDYAQFSKHLGCSGSAAEAFGIDRDLKLKMDKYELNALYSDIERPLIGILYRMEREGVTVDTGVLTELQKKLGDELKKTTDEIYRVAGRSDFNVNSTKQLGELLFNELKLKHGKKNKSGGYSTDIGVLEEIKGEHEIIPLILHYRELSKLLSTYINGVLPKLKDGKLHTVFNQTVTATGRLSSTEPNLQNIPIRKAIGREIRKMFKAGEGNVLVSADYSQIELRLLAHLSGDGEMIEAFRRGEDIHASTASKVFNVDIDAVTPDMRRRAKAVNFGIIYGISDYRLSQDIGTSVQEAREFIDRYFMTYPCVKKYLDGAIEFARNNKYQRTLFNRIRLMPDIASPKFNIRSFNERVAMNMPMQGSASDIIKIAMINVSKAFENRGLNAKIILQVHDELIAECPVEEEALTRRILKSEMEEAVSLDVPLTVDIESGKTWFDV